MATFPYPDEPTKVKAYEERVKAEYNAVNRPFPDPNDPDAFRHFARYGYSSHEMPEDQASNKHIQELHNELNPAEPPQPGQGTERPLIGPLRVENKVFRDDSGLRRVLFCSWFPALRVLRDNPGEFDRQMDSIAAAGYQGIRVFLAVGGWTPYWDGREVVPMSFTKWIYTGNILRTDQFGPRLEAWPNYDDLLRQLLRACRARKLRLHVTCGDMQIICPNNEGEIGLHKRFSRICAEEGGLDVIALAEVTNEFPINRYGSDSPESIAQMGKVIQVWEAAIPGVLTCMGAGPGDEEPAALTKNSTHGDIAAVHVTRQPAATCLKHTFGLVYWEGNYRGFPKAFWEGEKAGPGPDSFARQDDPGVLIALSALCALTGQADNWFQGAAVRSNVPLESEWGFKEIPPLMKLIPEDIAGWQHGSNGRGGIEYWWKGKQFITASYVDWDTAPPFPISTWTEYTGQTLDGIGTPRRVTGMIVGTFA